MSSSILEEIQLLGCPKLQTPINPDALCSLTSLKLLAIVFCPNWRSCWEEGLFCTTSLQLLWIGDFGEEYRYFPWPSTSTAGSPPSSHLTSLEYLCLGGWLEVNSLPDQLELLPVLRELQIWNFNGLESLPEWLGKLSSLQSLDIWNCPLLEKRCEKGIGEDWHKIAHIPKIRMNEEEIHELKCTLSLQMKHETPLQTESSVLGVSIPKSSRQRDMPSLSDKFMKLISLRSKRFLRKLISVKVGQIEFFDLGVQCLISQP